MIKYRKKPIEIEAFQMTIESRMDNSDWPNWLNQAWNGARDEEGSLQRVSMSAELPDSLEIVTLEGKHLVSWGDYIIRGIQGEIYPCKPDIFELTYESVLPSADNYNGLATAEEVVEGAVSGFRRNGQTVVEATNWLDNLANELSTEHNEALAEIRRLTDRLGTAEAWLKAEAEDLDYVTRLTADRDAHAARAREREAMVGALRAALGALRWYSATVATFHAGNRCWDSDCYADGVLVAHSDDCSRAGSAISDTDTAAAARAHEARVRGDALVSLAEYAERTGRLHASDVAWIRARAAAQGGEGE